MRNTDDFASCDRNIDLMITPTNGKVVYEHLTQMRLGNYTTTREHT